MNEYAAWLNAWEILARRDHRRAVAVIFAAIAVFLFGMVIGLPWLTVLSPLAVWLVMVRQLLVDRSRRRYAEALLAKATAS